MEMTILLMMLKIKTYADNGYEICVFFIQLFYLGNTFNEEDFDTMIFDAIKEREQCIIQRNRMEIVWDSKLALALQNSQLISSKALFILIEYSFKRSLIITFKREIKQRIRVKNEEDKEIYDPKNVQHEITIESLKCEIERLKSIINDKEKDNDEHDKYAELLSELYDKGVINQEGKFINSD